MRPGEIVDLLLSVAAFVVAVVPRLTRVPWTRWVAPLTLLAAVVQAIVNAYSVAFFDGHLRGMTVPLLDEAPAGYPEVRFEARGTGVSG